MKKRVFVTTSWDDGHILDKRVVKLLDKFKLKGTFYIPKTNIINLLEDGSKSLLREIGLNTGSLTEKDIIKIGENHEIGAHTLTHPKLSTLSAEDAKKEIVDSKKHLEDILGYKIKMFCYPYGDYNANVKEIVRNTGFLGARTVEMGITGFPEDFFEFGTTIQAFPRSVTIKLHKTYALPQKFIFSWESQVKRFFRRVLKRGGIFHIWGHSWEIEIFDMWDRLEDIFEYISNRENVMYLSNGECLENLKNFFVHQDA